MKRRKDETWPTLVDAGVRAGVLLAPVVPGLTSQPAKLERTIKAVADHGAAFVGSVVLHLKDGTRTHFLDYLSREFPELIPRYRRLYRSGPYVPKAYASEVRAVVKLIQDKCRLSARESDDDHAIAGTPAPLPRWGPRQESAPFGQGEFDFEGLVRREPPAPVP